jgi:murein DD-endopeptidase MepM/ murein hydrolase activator NlpD
MNKVMNKKETWVGHIIIMIITLSQVALCCMHYPIYEWRVKRQPFESEIKDFTAVRYEKTKFIWPVKDGKILSRFGPRGSSFHHGIDIAGNYDTVIYAAAEGRVVYSGNGSFPYKGNYLRGYGNVIIIEHSDNYFTLYAHNFKNFVKKGDVVFQSQAIGKVGDSGRVTTPHLHFEIWKGEKPLNPLKFLPKKR